jgi:branched-subunit amino acid aminotransferase/4-amino-4-deoxychorismate lyase
MSNVWWREDDVLVTPSLSTGVLPGVTRGAVAAIARAAGYRVREGSFTLSALLRADEAFTSSAVREIMPVIAVDGRELSHGEAASRLQRMLEDITDEYPKSDG